MRFAAFGRTQILFKAIEECTAAGHELVLIGTAPAAAEYRCGPEEFSRLAKRLSSKFFEGLNFEKHKDMIAAARPQVAISINWPGLIKTPILDLFQYGILNAHAGDLPRYRGNACPNWAILNGENEVVVTIHKMSHELDAGDIFTQARFPVSEDTYIGDLYKQFDETIPRLFKNVLNHLEAGVIESRSQPLDPILSLRCFSRRPSDGLIDWSAPAEKIQRLVRASSEPFSGAFSYLNGQKLTVWRARYETAPFPISAIFGQIIDVRHSTGEVGIFCGTDILWLQEVEYSGRRCRAVEVMKSTRERLGVDLLQEIEKMRAEIRKKMASTQHDA